ncbi:ApeA N-terminal domain 1-containing protein, partial [Paraburkholderia megapolitana]
MNKKYILNEQGYFWWHDEKYPNTQFAPENHVTGWLKIAGDGEVRLELDGMLQAEQHPLKQFAENVSSRRSPRPIQGITKKTGKKVLVIDAVPNGGQFNTTRFSFERYFATMCLVGDSGFTMNGRVPTFSEIAIDLTGFENWLQLGTLDVKQTRRVTKLQSDVVRDVVYNTEVGKLTFAKHTDVIEANGLHRFEAKVREFMTLSFRKRSALSPQEVREEFGALQDLMTLLTDSHFSLAWPTVQVSGSKKRFTFYFRRLISSSPPPELHELSTNFVQLKESLGEIYAAWRTKRDEFGPGFYSYLSTRRDINLYV